METKLILPISAAAVLAACMTLPDGPSVMALPGTGKSFELFRVDDANCRQYAGQQVGGSANQASSDSTVRSAALGTAVGALAGAAIGGRDGAASGAGMGLLVGTTAGSGTGQSSAYGVQRRYDNAYVQCMYAMGHRVPVAGNLSENTAPRSANYPPPPPPPSNPQR